MCLALSSQIYVYSLLLEMSSEKDSAPVSSNTAFATFFLFLLSLQFKIILDIILYFIYHPYFPSLFNFYLNCIFLSVFYFTNIFSDIPNKLLNPYTQFCFLYFSFLEIQFSTFPNCYVPYYLFEFSA